MTNHLKLIHKKWRNSDLITTIMMYKILYSHRLVLLLLGMCPSFTPPLLTPFVPSDGGISDLLFFSFFLPKNFFILKMRQWIGFLEKRTKIPPRMIEKSSGWRHYCCGPETNYCFPRISSRSDGVIYKRKTFAWAIGGGNLSEKGERIDQNACLTRKQLGRPRRLLKNVRKEREEKVAISSGD